ncbi:M50 family metallopeptidase [Croceicoccus marinus]|uniref:M50 family metallopeptidase n=1 Tax=Croceicoccus marinus TaxID=450378 RepID=A0A1Z1FAT7_9SPHN|nr:M50 family metallopeptidase [Croceicoccus marinus]ARU15911.1 hypothetical protein A9D14_06585 [Croceicoccus marinus]
MASRPTYANHKQRAIVLAMIAVASIAAWQTQIGSLLLYPFTILATWFLEMGHGLAAVIVGASFEHLVIYPSGSGYAQYLLPRDRIGFADAYIAACGPLRPAAAGSLLILSSRTAKGTRIALLLLGTFLLLSTVVWVGSVTGWIILPALGLAILAIALQEAGRFQQFIIQLLGVQACISVWSQFDYLFSTGGVSPAAQSDTAAIAEILFLPNWFWGALISAATVLMFLWSFSVAFREERPSRSRAALKL